MQNKKIGILAVHGSIAEHATALEQLKLTPVEVRAPTDFESLDGLILPGGESTTIGDLVDTYGLRQTIIQFTKSDRPVFGTCAGLILLTQLGLLDITVERNAYGRQLDSFEAELTICHPELDSGSPKPQKYICHPELDSGSPEPQKSTKRFRIKSGMTKCIAFPGVFIRAPKITKTSTDVEILAKFEDSPILVRQGNVYGATFHPELTDDTRIHKLIFT